MKLLWILCLCCGCPLSCPALDREAFTFTKYDLEVRVEPEQQRLAVRGRIKLRNDSASSQKNVSLQISSTLQWRSIHVAGEPVEFASQVFTSDIDHSGALSEAIVTLPKEIAQGQEVELEIGYEGTVPLDANRLTRIGVPEETAKHSDWDRIGISSTAVRGIGYVAWYPVATEAASLSEGSTVFDTTARWKQREQPASFNINLCALGEKVVSFRRMMNGTPQPTRMSSGRSAEGDLDAGCTEFIFQPLGLKVPTLAIGNYEVIERPGISILYLSSRKAAAESYALAFQTATPLVEEWFGTPRVSAQVADIEDAEAAPFESGAILFAPLNATNSISYQLTAVHQLTHAAFPSARPWIYEGIAHFAQSLTREAKDGRKSALDFMTAHRASLVEAESMTLEKAVPSEPSKKAADQSLINSANEEFYRSKSMYVWWMLRDMLGDEKLKSALSAYRSAQDTSPAYMQHLLETSSKRDLEWFFDDWVYRDRGLPDFRIVSAYPRKLVGNGSMVTVTIENLGNAGAEVPVILHLDGGEVTKRIEVRAKSKTSVRIEAQSQAREVVVNDGSVPESDISNNTFKIQNVPE